MPIARVQTPDGRIARLEVPEGTTPSQIEGFLAQQTLKEEPQESIGRTVLDQSLQGATFGFADEITDKLGAGIASVATGQPFGETLKEARSLTKERQDRQFDQHPLVSIGSNVAGGFLTGGAGATTKAGTAIGNSLRVGNPLSRIIKGSAIGAASGATFGAGTAQDEERGEGAKQGAILGAALGGSIPAIGTAGGAVKRAVIPKIDDALKPLAQRARDFGIPLRTDQVAPTRARNTVQKISQEIPFSGADHFDDIQRKSFTRAVAKTIGQDADDLSPSTIKAFRRDNKSLFDSVLEGKIIRFDPTDIDDIASLKGQIDETLGITDRDAKILKREIEGLLKDLGDLEVGGDKIANLRSNLLGKATGAKGGTSIFGQAIEKLDDIIKKNGTPEEALNIDAARRQWRNFKTLKPLLEDATDGTIAPTKLLNRVRANKFIDASNKTVGDDDLIDLARIGKEFLPKQGGSDTFQKTAFTVATGAGVGAANPLLALQGAGVLVANRGLQKTVSNQKIIDAALKASVKTSKKIPSSPLTALIAGTTSATK